MPPLSFRPDDEVLKRGLRRETAILDGEVDLAQIHRHDPACADIRVAHLGVPHLPCGKPRIGSVGDERGVGAGRHQPVEGGGLREFRRVALCLLPETPAVEDAQHHRFRIAHRSRLLGTVRPLLPGFGAEVNRDFATLARNRPRTTVSAIFNAIRVLQVCPRVDAHEKRPRHGGGVKVVPWLATGTGGKRIHPISARICWRKTSIGTASPSRRTCQ